MDPIEFVIRQFLNIGNVFSEPFKPIFIMFQCVAVFSLVICLARRNLMGRQERETERDYSGLCGRVIDNTREMIPEYEEISKEFSAQINDLAKDNMLVGLVSGLSSDIMVNAERDLFTHDIGNHETIAQLHMQLRATIKKFQNGGNK
jgi:hypothetical protein